MLTFTPTDLDARDQIAEWIEKDPDHAGRVDAGFFLPSPNTECFAVEDSKGPVFYVRAENVLRLHIQFCPERRRTVVAVDEFTKWIQNNARSRGYKQVIFDSVFQPIIKFLGKRGFYSSPDEQVMDL